MCSIASSTESTTPTASVIARYSLAQSSSPAACSNAADAESSAPDASASVRSSARTSTPGRLQRLDDARDELRRDVGVDQQRLGRVAHPGRWILALSTIASAWSRSAAAST